MICLSVSFVVNFLFFLLITLSVHYFPVLSLYHYLSLVVSVSLSLSVYYSPILSLFVYLSFCNSTILPFRLPMSFSHFHSLCLPSSVFFVVPHLSCLSNPVFLSHSFATCCSRCPASISARQTVPGPCNIRKVITITCAGWVAR